MKSTSLQAIALCLFSSLAFSTKATGQVQDSLFLKPGASEGKDAIIWDFQPDRNNGNNRDNMVYAWTYQGTPTIKRSLLGFDLSTIPIGAKILEASLSLFYSENSNDVNVMPHTGDNELVVERITANWEESKVTWNNQPATSSKNQLLIQKSAAARQDYVLDVSQLVQDMVDDPKNSHGFMLKLAKEERFRSVVLASSDNPLSRLHPELKVRYELLPTGRADRAVPTLSLFPNPSAGRIVVQTSQAHTGQPLTVKVLGLNGRLVHAFSVQQERQLADLAMLPSGMYTVQLFGGSRIVSQQKLILAK